MQRMQCLIYELEYCIRIWLLIRYQCLYFSKLILFNCGFFLNWLAHLFCRRTSRNIRYENFRSYSRPISVLSDVPVSRIWYNTLSNLYDLYLYKILYKNCWLNRSYSSNKQPIWKQRYHRGTWSTPKMLKF